MASKSPLRLYQRILFPTSAAPRILHSPSASAKLDAALYDLIALICREYILVWYTGISRDGEFVQQVATIIVYVLQALEVRLTSIDFVELLFLDLPSVLERHIADFDQAELKANSGHAHNLDRDSVFNKLQPHLAISLVPSGNGGVEPKVDRVYLRALVENLLRLLLPPEEYRSETERSIVREIITCLIFGAVFDKAAQPWFLHQSIAKALESGDTSNYNSRPTSSATNALSPPTFTSFLHSLIDLLASLPTLLRALLNTLTALYHTALSSPVPARYFHFPPLLTPSLSLVAAILPPSRLVHQIIHYLSFSIIFLNGFLTALVFYVVREKMLNVAVVEGLVETTSRVLFPGGHPPPKEEEPDFEGKDEWRRRCEVAVGRKLNPIFIKVFSHDKEDGTISEEERRLKLARYLLRFTESHVANVTLFLTVVDLVVGKVCPELIVGNDD